MYLTIKKSNGDNMNCKTVGAVSSAKFHESVKVSWQLRSPEQPDK